MDPRFYPMMYRPTRHWDPRYDRRFLQKPRYRYHHPLAYFMDMGVKPRRTTRHILTQPRHRTNANFHTEVLQLHNKYRAHHCAPPLTLDQRLNDIAQSYADHLAATSTFKHSGNKLNGENLGENLYMQWISQGPVKTSAQDAVKSWYDEIALYDFRRPKFSTKTGHFTQLVWKGTKKLGVGIAYSPDHREVYVVTNYYPAGNITNAGFFEKNVLPANC